MLPDTGQQAIASARAIAYWDRRPGPVATVARRFARLRHRFWSLLSGTAILPGAQVGARLALPHPNGVVIHQAAVVGDDCMIMQQVTLGQLAGAGAPRIGSRVYIGAGAKVLGSVVVGDDARIGANAVVLSDVPAGATAVGIPARVVRLKDDASPVSGVDGR